MCNTLKPLAEQQLLSGAAHQRVTSGHTRVDVLLQCSFVHLLALALAAVFFSCSGRYLLGGCCAVLNYLSFSLVFLYTPLELLLFVGEVPGAQNDDKETRRPRKEGDGIPLQTCFST